MLKTFSIDNVSEIRGSIIQMKKDGMTIPEIAEKIAPYCSDCSDQRIICSKVKNQWDNYVRYGMKDELVNDNEVNNCQGAGESQEISRDANGNSQSSLNIPISKLVGKKMPTKDEELLKLHGFEDVENWIIKTVKSSRWQAQGQNGDIIDMMSSKISVEPKNPEANLIREIIAANKEMLKKIGKRPVPKNNDNSENIAIVPFADFHLDKREGHNAMPFEAQEKRFYAIMNYFCGELKEFKKDKGLSKIVFYWSQDFFNYDNILQLTSSGKNKQEGTVGYQKMVSEGNMLLVNGIQMLEHIAPVELFYTRSNHDQLTAFNTMQGLYLAFKDDPNVIIDGLDCADRKVVWDEFTRKQMYGQFNQYDCTFDTAGRHYLMWGNYLFGFSHGDKEGKRIGSVMQNEADQEFARLYAKKNLIDYNGDIHSLPDFPEKYAWSKTKRHIFFCGHFHSKQKLITDDGGVTVIYLPSEMTGDAWHYDCGYIGAQRMVELYIYSKAGSGKVFDDTSENIKNQYEEDLKNGTIKFDI